MPKQKDTNKQPDVTAKPACKTRLYIILGVAAVPCASAFRMTGTVN